MTAPPAAAPDGRPAANQPESDEPIGVAVIGAGYWGPNLVRNFQGSPSFHLRALCDLDLGRAQRRAVDVAFALRRLRAHATLKPPSTGTMAPVT